VFDADGGGAAEDLSQADAISGRESVDHDLAEVASRRA